MHLSLGLKVLAVGNSMQ